MSIILFGINHKTAPVEIREKFSISKHQVKSKLLEWKNNIYIEGFVIVSTCNRTEIYINAVDLEKGKAFLINNIAKFVNCSIDKVKQYSYIKDSHQAIHHLFRVSAGLDSMILGESQILGQIQDAYETALNLNTTCNILNNLFQKAITIGKKVRTDTCIDRQAVSISSAAVELIKQVFGSLKGKSVLVLGAGETSELTSRHLLANGISTVFVANRTYERAQNLAEELGGCAIRLEQFKDYLARTDIIISCTAAPRYIVEAEDIKESINYKKENPLLLIDIAVPRDINPEVSLLPNVILYDVDDLQNVVQKNIQERKKEAVKAEFIINEELVTFLKWLDTLIAVPTIISFKQKINYIKEKELQKALRKLDNINEKEKKVVKSLANSIINQILHSPITNLKECVANKEGLEYIETLHRLFDLEEVQEKS